MIQKDKKEFMTKSYSDYIIIEEIGNELNLNKKKY